MIQEFVEKLNKNEYISNYLFEYVRENDSSVIPTDFNLDEYNNKIIDRLMIEHKDYFDHQYDGISNIKLDDDQRRAILTDEKYALIVAGAGTGKTTTMASKIKYLVDIKHVNPNRILVLSYGRKATEELICRINVDFDIPARVCTFHSLGYRYIREIYKDRKCVIVDTNKRREVFLEYYKQLHKDKKKIREIIRNFSPINKVYKFMFGRFYRDNFYKYDNYEDFFNAYIENKMIEAKNAGVSDILNTWIEEQLSRDDEIKTIKGDIVKSASEAVISNFLFVNGIDYEYEEVYEDYMEENIIYKPDFTINYGGTKIYIEYFGLNDSAYNKIKNKKIKYHELHHNNFISIDRVPIKDISEYLDKKLNEFGIEYNKRTDAEIWEYILRLNPLSQVFKYEEFMYDCVDWIKESPYRDNISQRINEYIKTFKDNKTEYNELCSQAKLILDFYKYYSDQLYGGEKYYFDYSDMLYYADKYIDYLTKESNLYDYIIIDEYQDISSLRYKLLKKTADRNDSNVFAVGDDWQAIFSFAGSRIDYFYNFNSFFNGAKLLKINKTHRNSQELINISSDFIMQNPMQIPKELISDIHNKHPVVFKSYNGVIFNSETNKYESNPFAEINCLKETLIEIHKAHPNYKILVISRYNDNIDSILDDKDDFINGINSRVIYKSYDSDINFDVMSIHKSKGLTYDIVIVIGLSNSFPHDAEGVWVEELFKNPQIDEGILYPEERRVLYVALTRTKTQVILLHEQNPKYRSEFIDELKAIVKENYSKTDN